MFKKDVILPEAQIIQNIITKDNLILIPIWLYPGQPITPEEFYTRMEMLRLIRSNVEHMNCFTSLFEQIIDNSLRISQDKGSLSFSFAPCRPIPTFVLRLLVMGQEAGQEF